MRRLIPWGICVFASLAMMPVEAESQFAAGHWRLELSGLAGLNTGGNDCSNDFLTTGTVEYEFPVSGRCTLGLRLMPLFLYTQDLPESDVFSPLRYDDSTVIGGGGGLALRLYQVKSEYRGLFVEAQANALGHEGRLNKNSSNLNFLTGLGVGYKFENAWHALVKFEHISNADLGDENSGANLLGVGIGYSF